MTTLREIMKSLLQLWHVMATDVARQCDTSATRDIKTVTRRVEQEGDSFLTITLPAFEKDFVRSLDLGKVEPSSFRGFSKNAGSPLPRFLGGLTSQVFDASTGVLLHNPSVDAIAGVRLLTLAFGKVERRCSDGRVARAFAGYVMTDRMVEEWQRKEVGNGPKGQKPFHPLFPGLVPGEFCQLKTCQYTMLTSDFRLVPHWHLRQYTGSML